MIWEVRKGNETADEKLAEKFTKRETPAQRRRRIASKPVDAATAAAVLRMFNTLSFYKESR